MDISAISSVVKPSPLEIFLPPTSLNGEFGSNRAPTTIVKQIDANNDLQAIQTWLLEFTHSPQTLRTYRETIKMLGVTLTKIMLLSQFLQTYLDDYIC